jgi:cytochrome c biogenesis protein CcdA
MGLAMLGGWKPKITTPALTGGKDRTVFSMFLFGIAYAVASIGCTIGFLTTVIFGSISAHGFLSGMMSVVLYGLGMAMLVTALTVTLAFAQGGLLQLLRNGIQYIDRVAAVFVVLTGLYLSWYWYAAIAEKKTGSVVGNVENWQGDIATFLQRQGAWKLGIIFAVVITLAFVFIQFRSEDRNSTHV